MPKVKTNQISLNQKKLLIHVWLSLAAQNGQRGKACPQNLHQSTPRTFLGFQTAPGPPSAQKNETWEPPTTTTDHVGERFWTAIGNEAGKLPEML